MSEVPMFDVDSPDIQSLEAFETARQLRRGEDEEDRAYGFEEIIHGNFHTTIPGIVARLQLVIIASDQTAHVETTLFGRGWMPLVKDADARALDGNAGELIRALDELIHFDWEQKLAAYERSRSLIDAMYEVKAAVDDRTSIGAGVDDVFAPLENVLITADEGRALMKVLAPDFAAFNRKAEIMIAEELGREALPWLLRDVRYMVGNLDADPSVPKKEAA